MEQRANFLALTLLDALEDENEADILSMLERNNVNAGIVPCDRGLAPLHYVCGMRNAELARRILERFLECPDLDVDALCDGKTTALHIASIYGREELVRMLLERGARADLADEENKLPVHYAIEECHFEVLQLLRDHIFREKQRQKSQSQRQRLQPSDALTPTQLRYNYDTTSPYYINITHRRHRPQPKYPEPGELGIGGIPPLPDEESVNLFALTEAHLTQLIQSQRENPPEDPDYPKQRSLIESWREKVERSRARQSLLHQYDEHVEALVEEAMSHEDFNYEQHLQQKLRSEEKPKDQQEEAPGSGRQVLEHLVEQVSRAVVVAPEPEHSFFTAQGEEEQQAEVEPAVSPRQDEYFLQIKEAYVHTDDENGLVFYEAKFLQNSDKREPAKRPLPEKTPGQDLDSTVSTNLDLPLDYETDALRRELTQLGAPVGPITKTTKRLYIKQLIKYKRNTEALQAAQKHAQEAQIRYSVELHRTLRSPEDFARISDYLPHEAASAEHFSKSCLPKKNLREGHLKQSFIYMLIDPRISRNLPGESAFLDKFGVWQRFLDSIFYVGKGKSSRPYAHLYDAMRQHTRLHQQRDKDKTKGARGGGGFRKLQPEVFRSPPPVGGKMGSRKLERILDIWQHGSGVVCLHVFHNIMPIDAYTREASIIDAMGLAHLTNLKRGDYYGPAQSWTMKQKKQLGIALLFKAMQIYLAEGESQLSPSDLL